MSSESPIEFTKANLDTYLKEVAKEYRKQIGKNMPAEMILIGGAAVLVNYGFRNMTIDIDAVIQAASVMKDAINNVAYKFNLPTGWLNDDFMKTSSYSPKLEEFSQYYKTYSNVLTIRTISAEYLIAMKLRSGRQYKSDLSDVLGILTEHKKNGNPITLNQIQRAVIELYGDWNILPELSQAFIAAVMANGHFEELYTQALKGEQEARELLISFEQDYPGIAKEENANNIAQTLQKKASKTSILKQLQTMKEEKNKKD